MFKNLTKTFEMEIKMGNLYAYIESFHSGVTGSLILIVIKIERTTYKVVIDCGLFQGKEDDNLNGSIEFNVDEIDAILVTHNHIDHIGRLPFVVKKGYNNKIYTTKITKNLMRPALTDSCKVLKDIAKRRNTFPLYKELDVENTLRLVEGCEYNQSIQILPNVRATFFPNGHLLGASIILLNIHQSIEDINILFTGDYNSKNTFFKVSPLPKWLKAIPLTLVLESTYGNMDSSEITYVFEKNIEEATRNQKNIVIPVFSLGRAQEILYVIKTMQEEEKISKNYKIYLDGSLSQKYTYYYLSKNSGIDENMKDFLPQNIEFITKDSRMNILANPNAKIVITSSGMGSYGPAHSHIPAVLSHEN